MHTHDHQDQPEGLRTSSPRVDDRETGPVVARALAAGRPDLLGSSGLTYLQRTAGNASTAGLVDEERSPVLDVLSSGGGRPLEPEVRSDMEGRLGHDFGDVRVHTDGAAESSARAVNAHAYTVGSHIAFQRSAYDPGSEHGRTTLAHELTHVVQQRSGPVDGTEAPGGIRVSDPSDRFEREAAATATEVVSAPAPVAAAPAMVQREAAEEEPVEEPTAQGTFVQRAEEEEPVEEPPAE